VTPPELAVALLGLVAGIAMVIVSVASRSAIVWSAAVAMAAAVAVTLGAPPLLGWALIPSGVMSLALGMAWQRRPPAVQRSLWSFEMATRRQVLAFELIGLWRTAVPASLVAVGLAATAAGDIRWAAWSAVVVLGLLLGFAVGFATDLTVPEVGRPDAGEVPAQAGGIIVVVDPSPERRSVLGLVGALRASGRSVAVAFHPPVLHRGLGGWNLGLGLDTESAAWAAQLARALGLGGYLAEPAPLVPEAVGRRLTVCRALASPVEVIILDEPIVGLGPSEMRDLAKVTRRAIGDRELIVVSADTASIAAFLARVQSRT
jgi:hypothetical protein